MEAKAKSQTRRRLRERIIRFLKKMFVFAVLFAGSASLIAVDTHAAGAAGSEALFSSSFIRKNAREVEVKIMGFEMILSGGIASQSEE